MDKYPIICVCPTYRRPALLKNSVALFLGQTIECPSLLLIFDDGVNFIDTTIEEKNKTVILRAFENRFPTLGHKYNKLVETAVEEFGGEYIFIWEDDDVYLPFYIKSYMTCFDKGSKWIKTEYVKTYFRAKLSTAYAAPSYFASLAFARDAYDKGIRFVEDGHDNFDIFFMRELERNFGSFCDPTKQGHEIGYIFRWDTTKNYHGQGYMRGIKNYWYEYVEKITKAPDNKEVLTAVYDEESKRLIDPNS